MVGNKTRREVEDELMGGKRGADRRCKRAAADGFGDEGVWLCHRGTWRLLVNMAITVNIDGRLFTCPFIRSPGRKPLELRKCFLGRDVDVIQVIKTTPCNHSIFTGWVSRPSSVYNSCPRNSGPVTVDAYSFAVSMHNILSAISTVSGCY